MSENQQTLHALPRNTVSLIGSCQVITSVYSVVKELVENSLDGKASSVDIKLEDYGLEKIEVGDNGCGVKTADVPFMAKRHFTSKITCSDDLNALNTYGFRGEALGSLCAVSKVTITTKTVDDPLSYVYTINSEGDIVEKKPSHSGKGTAVISRDLFHNVPVRKQYYSANQRKKDDLKRVEHLLMAYAIVRPDLRLTLKHGKELVFQKTAMKDAKTVLHSVLSRKVANQLLYKEKNVEEVQLKVSAFLPKPGSDVKDMSLASPEKTIVAVNSRPVSIPEINKILKSYYSNCHGLDTYRHPVCFISLEVASNQIDVNVDPNKTKVFFQQKLEIQNTLEEILLEIYGPLDNVPSWHYSDANSCEESKETEQDPVNSKVWDQMIPSRPTITYSKWPDNLQSTAAKKSNVPENQDEPMKSKIGKESNFGNTENLPSFSVTFHKKSISQTQPDSIVGSEMDCTETLNKCNDTTISSQIPSVRHSSGGISTCNSGDENRCNGKVTSLNASDPDADRPASTVTAPDDIRPKDSGTLPYGKSSDEQQLNSDSAQEVPICNVIVLDQADADSISSTNQEIGELFDSEMASSNAMNIENSEENGIAQKEIDPDNWSRGNVTFGNSVLQPVKLLPPTSEMVPGKRPLSPQGRMSLGQPKKKAPKLILPTNQATLFDMVGTQQQIKKPNSSFTFFFEEKFPSLSQEFPKESETAIAERVKEAWDGLNDEERISYKEKCWHDTKRYEKERKTCLVNGAKTDSGMAKKTSGGSERSKRVLKKRLYCEEKTIRIPINEIRNQKEALAASNKSDEPMVVGPAYKSDDVWFFTLHEKLYLVNVWRVSEVDLYKKLKAMHQLPFKPCDPLPLDSKSISQQGLVALENLARKDLGHGTFFHIKDERVLYNGFDIKCHCDSNGNFTSELVGICNAVPTYDLKDLNKVLEVIGSNPSVQLSETRTLKAAYYLQGEAVRMTRQNVGKKSLQDIVNMLPFAVTSIDQSCLHHKPIFKEVINFASMNLDGD